MEKGPGYVSFRRMDQISADVILDSVSRVIQSNALVLATSGLELNVTRVVVPAGRGPPLKSGSNSSRRSAKEQTTTPVPLWILPFLEKQRRGTKNALIEKTDNLCFPKALVIGRLYANAINEGKVCTAARNLNLRESAIPLKQQAEKLCRDAGVIVPPEGCTPEHARLFQNHMPEYNIVVFQPAGERRPHDIIFRGFDDPTMKHIWILHNMGHYVAMESLTAGLGCDNYCMGCYTEVSRMHTHVCSRTCSQCKSATVCDISLPRQNCELCNRHFYGRLCFEHHLGRVCKNLKKCLKCRVHYTAKEKNHQCFSVYCRICYCRHPKSQPCYIQVDETRVSNSNKNLFIYFDFECRQEKEVANSSTKFLHEVNLCVAMQNCAACETLPSTIPCVVCGPRRHIFTGVNVLADFIAYVMRRQKKFKTVTCVSHNGQSYDSQFILKYLAENAYHIATLVQRGSKIMLIQHKNVRFIDSLNFIPLPLSKFSSAFDLTVSKGMFPHYFNTLANQNYVGPIPDVRFYDPDSMGDKARAEFLNWHAEKVRENYVFNFQKEIIEYCKDDVEILMKACTIYRRLLIEKHATDPLLECITLASTAHKIFRRKYLKPNTIAMLPLHGYRLSAGQSIIALKWLILIESRDNIRIQHLGREKEVLIGSKFRVDGFCAENNTVYEFLGCFYHGHDICFPSHRDKHIYRGSNETYNSRFERTMDRLESIRRLGFRVEYIWECEFRDKYLNRNPNLDRALTSHPVFRSGPLLPRDALAGGRTSTIKLYHEAGVDEKIMYLDVCSLYPYTLKYKAFPVGLPKVYALEDCQQIVGQSNDISRVDGLIKAEVLPPRDLYHPVLPLKTGDKLLFPLCRTCANELNQSAECDHSEAERAITGTWVSEELKLAVTKNYKIIRIIEIWQYKLTCFNPATQTGGLFAEYMNDFLKLKQEASGFPDEAVSDSDKDQYIRDYYKYEGVELDRSKIIKNNSKRQIAKLFYNSLWGKFCERVHSTTVAVNTLEEFYDIFLDPKKRVVAVIPGGLETIYIEYEYSDPTVCPVKRNTNLVLGAFCTALARIHLYKFLDALQERVLYMDTDSVIFTVKNNESIPEIGPYLGQLTDELAGYGRGTFITHFASTGPKSYAYKYFSPSTNKSGTVCKVKGITLNHRNAEKVNFDAIRDAVLNEASPVTLNFTSITRTRDHNVVTVPAQKTFRINFTKRRRLPDNTSVPFGFKKQRRQ